MIAVAPPSLVDAVPVVQTLAHRRRVALVAGSCAHWPEPGLGCQSIELSTGSARRVLGAGYSHVRLLWSGIDVTRGPYTVALGVSGGSGGFADVISLGPAGRVQKLSAGLADEVTIVRRRGRAALDLPFTLAIRQPSNAATAMIPIPLRWTGRAFDLDLEGVAAKRFDAEELLLRFRAVRTGLQDAGEERGAGMAADSLQLAVQALAGLMLAGRADLARTTLDAAWLAPDEATSREAFWREVCGAVVREPLWSTLRLDRLPKAALIEAGARAASR